MLYFDRTSRNIMKNKEELEKKTGIKCISSIDGIKCISSIDGIKKFDICLMNPPYDRGLHLKFLEETLKICENVITIQPCGFLENTLSNNYKKYKETIINKIVDADIIPMMKARDAFNINISEDVMIAHCNAKNNEEYKIISPICLNIIKKILPYTKEHKLSDMIEIDKIDGHRVKAGVYNSLVFGGRGSDNETRRQPCGYIDGRGPYLDGYNEGEDKKYIGKWFKDCYAKGGPKNSKQFDNLRASIKFNTREEALNFQKSCDTEFCKNWNFIMLSKNYCIVPPSFDKVWTNEDYCKFFKLTDEESQLMCQKIYDYRKEKFFINNYISNDL